MQIIINTTGHAHIGDDVFAPCDFESKSPATLADIETYASHAINDIRDLQGRLRHNATVLGMEGGFLLATADALDDIVHDELAPALKLAREVLDTGNPQTLAAWGAKGDHDRSAA